MTGVLYPLAAVFLLAIAFMAARASARPRVQSRGPWLIGAAACLLATLITWLYETDFSNLSSSAAPHHINDIVLTALVMAVLALEAVLISLWAMKNHTSKARYLVVFSCTTVVAWFITFFVMSATIPGS